MLYIIAALLLFALMFTGIGLLAASRWDRSGSGEPALAWNFSDLLRRFWVGWALTIAGLQIWHLFFKVGAAAFWLALILGLSGWIISRRSALSVLRGLRPISVLAVAALALIPAAALAAHVFFVPPHYDHGLYHQQTVMWFNNFAIVPGLGNLHHRLAFNNSNFLYAAMLNAAPPGGRAFFTANTLLAFVVILQCAAGFMDLFRRPANGQASRLLSITALYYALMLPAVLWHYSTTHLPGYSPDVVVFSLQAVLGGELLRLLEESADRGRPFNQPQFLTVLLLAVAGVTVKLSFGVFGALAVLTALALFIRNRRTSGIFNLRGLALPFALAALLVISWLLRGVLLSGYPLFPSTILPAPVSFRLPLPLVEPISPIILNWARTASQTIPYTGDLAWLRQWYAVFPFDVVKRVFLLSLIAAGAGLLWLAMRLIRSRKPAKEVSPGLWDATAAAALLITSGLSLAAWFFLAPDYRFSGALFWMLMAAALTLLCSLLAESGLTRDPLRLAMGVLLAVTILVSPNHFEIHKPGQQVILPQSEAQWVQQFFPDLPRMDEVYPAFETRITRSGLVVYLPIPPSDQCFTLPLPCTRAEDYLPGLRLIQDGSLQRGFTLQP